MPRPSLAAPARWRALDRDDFFLVIDLTVTIDNWKAKEAIVCERKSDGVGGSIVHASRFQVTVEKL